MPLCLGNLTKSFTEVSEEELWMQATEDEIRMMDALRILENYSNALEIMQKAKATSSNECMAFANDLIGSDVSIEQLTESVEAAETNTVEALGAMIKSTLSIAENYNNRLKKMNPNILIQDPKYIQSIVKNAKQLYPFVRSQIPEKFQKLADRLVTHFNAVTSERNVKTVTQAMDVVITALKMMDGVFTSPMVSKLEAALPSSYLSICGTMLRLMKAGVRAMWTQALKGKVGDGKVNKQTQVLLRAGRMGTHRAIKELKKGGIG